MKSLFYLNCFVLLLLFSCKSNQQETKPVIKDIEELVFASGELEWNNQYNLIAQTDGMITNLALEEGQEIAAGQFIGNIDNQANIYNKNSSEKQLEIANENASIQSPQLKQLEKNMFYAELKYQQDEIQVKRYQRLYENQSIAKVELENIRLVAIKSAADWEALKDQYKQAKLQGESQQITSKNALDNNKILSGYNNIKAAQTGKVIKKYKEIGDYVRKGDPIALVGDEKLVKAVLNIDEESMGKIKLGQMAYIQLNADKNKIYKGKITEILPAFDAQSQSFVCKVEFIEPLDFSLSQAKLEANVLVGSKKNALLIPRSYLDFGDKVNLKGKDEKVKIKTGIISTDWVEVLEGLSKEEVIIEPK